MSPLPWLTVLHGDVREVLPSLDAGSVHCVVTSPPYFGLRDYGTASWDGGDPECGHVKAESVRAGTSTLGIPADGGARRIGAENQTTVHKEVYRARCGKCGAVRQDSQIGLEATPELYVEALVAVFREVRRVLRDDGTVWLNLGDVYSAGGRTTTNEPSNVVGHRALRHANGGPRRAPDAGLKPKDLIGVPWRVAFALQADGWFLRSAITLCKRNPMPESVTDRPTSATEMMFLLTKRGTYWYDADAVREPASPLSDFGRPRPGEAMPSSFGNHRARLGNGSVGDAGGRNLRNWWEVSSEPYPGAHFATFGQKWITPCILAGCPDKVCAECGAPWERVVERTPNNDGYRNGPGGSKTFRNPDRHETPQNGSTLAMVARYAVTTTGWTPTCAHDDAETVPGVVLDPFAGTGTALLVANKLSRRAIGIDLSGEYLEQLATRNQQTPLGLVG